MDMDGWWDRTSGQVSGGVMCGSREGRDGDVGIFRWRGTGMYAYIYHDLGTLLLYVACPVFLDDLILCYPRHPFTFTSLR
jgi:hypothetical protein